MAAAKALAQAAAEEKVHVPLSEEERKIISMGYAYEEMLGRYLHKPAIRYFSGSKKIPPGQYARTNIVLFKAVLLADRHNVDYSFYIRSQFYFFDLWFKRAPKIYEIAGQSGKFPAEKRLLEYLALERSGKINKSISSVVVPTKKNVLTPQILDKINRERLDRLCEVYNLTEAEVLAQFAPVGLFDLAWLRRQPGFQPQREDGP
jgi:hypothetical protein